MRKLTALSVAVVFALELSACDEGAVGPSAAHDSSARTGAIVGRVVAGVMPVPGIAIRITGAGADSLTTTDFVGGFRFERVLQGPVSLIVEAATPFSCLMPVTTAASVTAGGQTNVNIPLSCTTEITGTLTVEGPRPSQPLPVDFVSAGRVLASGSMTSAEEFRLLGVPVLADTELQVRVSPGSLPPNCHHEPVRFSNVPLSGRRVALVVRCLSPSSQQR
jgi:hypothetical protein